MNQYLESLTMTYLLWPLLELLLVDLGISLLRKNEILDANKADINADHIQGFINKCINKTEISDKNDYAIIRDFEEWFNGLDFDNMRW